MKTYVIDGSNKGIVIGAGVVDVNELGFLDLHSFTTYHAEANSLYAEIFALENAIELIKESEICDNITIYTDNQSVHSLFSINLSKRSNDPYIQYLKNQISLLGKFVDFDIRLKDRELESVHKIAHNLSRQYLNDTISNVIISQSPSFSLREKV